MATGIIIPTTQKVAGMHLMLDSANTYSRPSLFMVGTGTTTPAVTDTALETPVDITIGVQIKAFVSGYPTFDDSNLIVKYQGILLTTDAEGNSLTESGLFNSDGTPVMLMRAVNIPITKTNAVQVFYTWKLRAS